MTEQTSLPTGTVTFLFTDIQGSTRLLQELGERYADLLAEHHRVVREIIASHSGIEVGTEGDAFFVAFADVDDAVRAAAAAQRAFAEHSWGVDGGLKVRMGIHTGKGTVSDGNYVGIDVHRGARIASAAHGGQVLISGATGSHVERTLPEGTRLKKIGTYRLKDLEHPEELLQLCIDGLETDFPSPRTPDTRPNNLPARVDRFVTRERELQEIFDLLPHSRLLTLTGPGGTGKTRLGLEVAYEKMLSFRDGTFVVFLATLDDPQHVSSSVADALGVVEQGTTPIENSIKEWLGDKQLLLVLDNFEQVTEAAPFVADLLAAAPELRIVVTSRIRLHVSGEQEYPVPPMAVPDPDSLPPLDQLHHYEAIDLFVERARAVNPRFSLSEENAPAVTRICRQLDGLPLAIELAAARTKVLSPEDILRRLQDGLGILSGGARDLPARQQTLKNAIAWSYDLLDESCARLFTRLGAFPGGWTFESAESVCNAEHEIGVDPFEALETLVENSLVRSVADPLGGTRFRMLQTIREFAVELLDSGPDSELVRGRHADHFCRMAGDLSGSVTLESDAPERLSIEHDNLRAALRWLIDRDEAERALAMSTHLWRFWQIRSHLSEGRRWIAEVLAMPGAQARTAVRVRALIALGSITYWQNDWPATQRFYDEALTIARELGDPGLMAEAAYNSGFLYLGLLEDDFARAKELFSEALDIFDRLDERAGQANALWALAMAYTRAREHEEALKLGERSGAIFRELNDWYGQELARFVSIQNHRLMGAHDKAEQLTWEILDRTAEAGDVLALSSYFGLLGNIWIARGRAEEGLRLAAAGEAIRASEGGGAPPQLMLLEDPREFARGHLSDDRVDEIAAEGLAMSADEALAFARKAGPSS